MDVISETKRKAIKEHRCDYCNAKIENGETYNSTTIVNYGDIYTWKSHEICDEIADALNMHEHPYDEGLTANDFQEMLWDFASEKRPDIKSYKQALKWVKEEFINNKLTK